MKRRSPWRKDPDECLLDNNNNHKWEFMFVVPDERKEAIRKRCSQCGISAFQEELK